MWKLETMPPIKPKIDPRQQDGFHVGTDLGTNVVAMHPNFIEHECPYIILVDRTTGQRLRIEFNVRQRLRKEFVEYLEDKESRK